MSKDGLQDKLFGIGLYLLFGVVLFLAFMGIKYLLIALCVYSAVQLLTDMYYMLVGSRTTGTISGFYPGDPKFYENDEYGFRRHPNVVAPPEPGSEAVMTGVSYSVRSLVDGEYKDYKLPSSFWYGSKMIGRDITLFYLPRYPEKARHISVFWFIMHAIPPLIAVAAWLGI